MQIQTSIFFFFFVCGDGDGGKILPIVTLKTGIGIMPSPYGDICPESILIISPIKLIFIIFLIQK